MSDKDFQVGGPRATYVLVICSALYGVNYMDRQVLSVVLEPMRLDLGLTDTQAGMLQTVFLLSMGALSMPVAYWVDRWSRSKMIAAMAVLWSIATFATGLGKSYIGVLVPRMVTGVGEAGFSSGSTALIAASYPETERARKLGWFNMSIILGIGVGLVGGGYLSENFGGWRTPFYVFAVPGIILGILALFMQDYKNPPREAHEKPANIIDNVLTVLRVPAMRWIYIGYGMQIMLAFSIMVWVPALLMRRFEIGEGAAGIVMAVGGALGAPGALVGGRIADWWQSRHPAGWMRFAAYTQGVATVCAMVSVLAVVFLHKGSYDEVSIWLVVGALAFSLFSMLIIAGIPAVGASTQALVPPNLKGMAWGLAVLFQYLLGGGWGPALAGRLSDMFGGGANGLGYALMITASAGFICFACWIVSSMRYPDDAKEVAARNAG